VYHRYDQFAKNLLRDALTPAANAETEVEVTVARQMIDVWCVPDPARDAERARLGLLGEMATEPSLFEPFRNTPSLDRVRSCLRKQLNWHHELERRARSAAGVAPEAEEPEVTPMVPFPTLVVISPGRPETVLGGFGCRRVRRGVYQAVRDLKLRVVVLAELPQTRQTLLLRLLGKGRVLLQALSDLERLSDDAWEKGIATPLLLHFHFVTAASATNEEDEMSAEIQAWYEEYQQKQKKSREEALRQGLEQGRKQGLNEGARSLLLRQLSARFGNLPAAVVSRIGAAGAKEIERWGERVLKAQTLDEVLDDPS
jgi:hypothetical protein